MSRGLKITLLVIGVPMAAFAAIVIIFAISEALAPDQYFATKSGLSLGECERTARTLGASASDAREICWRRIPK
jgi:hypothetical protein